MAGAVPSLGQAQVVRKKRRKKIGWKEWFIFFFLLSFVLVWMLPIMGAITTSMRTMDDLLIRGFWRIPTELTGENFVSAWTTGRVGRYLYNSFLVTIPALLGTLFLSSMAGFSLAHYSFRGVNFIYILFVGGMLIPFQVLMIPVFRLSNFLGIYNTYWGLVMIHMVFQMGFCTFFLRNFMMTIPHELANAARIDGCSEFRIFFQIYLPLSKPALAAVGILEFTWIFNDYLWALVLIRDDSLKPITAGLATLRGHFIASWNVLVAGSLLASIPTLLVFILLQKYFIAGLTMGSGK